jgi:S-layer protein
MANPAFYFGSTNEQINGLFIATFGVPSGSTYLAAANSLGLTQTAQILINATGQTTAAGFASLLQTQLGLTDINSYNYIVGQINAAGGLSHSGATLVTMLNLFAGLTADPVYGSAASAYVSNLEAATAYSLVPANNSTDLSGLQSLVTLTSGPDIATANNFVGTGETFTALDFLTGAPGVHNKLTVTDTTSASAAGLPSEGFVTNVQTFNLTSVGSVGATGAPQVNTYVMPNTSTTGSQWVTTFASPGERIDGSGHAIVNEVDIGVATSYVDPAIGDTVRFSYGAYTGTYAIQAATYSSGSTLTVSSQYNTAIAFANAFNAMAASHSDIASTAHAVVSTSGSGAGTVAYVTITDTTTAATPALLQFTNTPGQTNTHNLPDNVQGYVGNPTPGAVNGHTVSFIYNGVTSSYAIGVDASTTALNFAAALNAIAAGSATVSGSVLTVTGPANGVPFNLGFNSGTSSSDLPSGGVSQAAANGGVGTTVYDVTAFTGLANFNVVSNGTVGDNIKAALTTNVTDTANKGSVTLSGGLNVTVAAAGAVTIDGSAGLVTVNQAVAGNIAIGGTAAVTGAVVVTDTAQGASTIAVDGGAAVSITTSAKGAGTTGAISVGVNTAPSGTVTIADNLSGSTTGNTTGGAITLKGGTAVSVTETAVQPIRTTAGANSTLAQAAVTVTGTAATTSVSVTQAPEVLAAATVVAVAGATEIVSEAFAALTAGQTLTVGGLTFTAGSAGTTPAQTAAAFANLRAGALQGNSVLGTYSGAFSGWNTSAVTGAASVVFTSATANTAASAPSFGGTGTAPTATVVTTGVTTVAAAGTGGISNGVVGITDVNYSSTAAIIITTASISGYGAGATVSSSALTSLSLANSNGAAATVNNKTATTLALTVNNLKAGSTINLDGGTAAKYAALNITTAGKDSAADITATGITALTVTGTNVVDLTSATAGHLGNAATALKTVTVSGAAGLKGVFTGANVTDVNASATSGNVTVTIDPTAATYEGGSGVDALTLSVVAPSKVISLGAGNDKLTLASGTTYATAAIDGGAGTDSLVMDAADAKTASLTNAFASKVAGFEVLQLNASGAAQTVHVDTLGGYNAVSTGAAAVGALTLDGFTSGGSLTLTTAINGGSYVVSSAAFAAPTTDVFNVVVSNAAGISAGSVTANKVETINLTSTDTTATHAAGTNTNSLTLVGDSVTAITVLGNANLTLTSANTTVTLVDASGMTGGLTYTTAGTTAETVKGGVGVNTLTAHSGYVADTLIAGAGGDTLISNAGMDTLVGGSGNDTFVISAAGTNSSSFSTIIGASVGDTIKLAGLTSIAKLNVVLASTAVFQDYANVAVQVGATTTHSAVWFQYGGDTYIVENLAGTETKFLNGTDISVKLAGLVDLSHTSLATTNGTLLIG